MIRRAYLEEATGYTWEDIPWDVMYELCCSSVYWICYFFSFRPTEQQAELLDLVERGLLRMACKSGQGPGKKVCLIEFSFPEPGAVQRNADYQIKLAHI